jgi:hypothetical protein
VVPEETARQVIWSGVLSRLEMIAQPGTRVSETAQSVGWATMNLNVADL